MNTYPVLLHFGYFETMPWTLRDFKIFSPQPTNLAEGYCYPPFRLSVRPSVRLLAFEMQ